MNTIFKTMAAAAVMTLVGVTGVDAGGGDRVQLAASDHRKEAEFRQWKRNWARRARDFDRTKPEQIAWGKEKRPVRSRMILLDPPIAKTSGPEAVQVEVFRKHIDERGSIAMPLKSRLVMLGWRRTVREANLPVTLSVWTVGKGPGLTPRFDEQRRLHQEIMLAWGEDAIGGGNIGKAARALLDESAANGLMGLKSREDGAKVIERAGLDHEKWLNELAGSEQTQGRIQKINDRYAQVMNQAVQSNSRVLQSPMDPVLLIDGKYLLTGSVVGKTQDLYRMANWLIRHRIEQNPRHGFEMQQILWGNERKPRRTEIIELKNIFSVPDPSKIDIEWLYTYISNDGMANQREWHEELFNEWLASVRRGQVWDIKLRRTPVSKMNATDGPWTEHRRMHQRLILAWDENEGMRRGTIHPVLNGWVRKDPRSVGNVEQAKALVEYTGIPATEWHRRMQASETVERMKTADTKATAGRGKGHRTRQESGPRSPVIIVDGRYLIDRTSAGSVEKVFQILNWIVRLRHQSMTQTETRE